MALDMQSVYVLASGSSRAMEQLDTVTNNLANVNTSGFKKMVIKEMSQRLDENGGDSNHLFVFPRFERSLIQNTQGPIHQTQNPLDFAIDGEGFFKIETKNGPLYTRDGHFFLDKDGYIVDDAGNFLLDSEGAKIQLQNSNFTVAEDGTIYQDGTAVAKIAIENFSDIEAVGDTYYKPKSPKTNATYKVLQGALEGSNVNPVQEMSSMIVAQRRFEMYGNMIKSLDQLTQKTNEIGKA